MIKILSKICIECGKEYQRPYGQGMKIWNKRKFCSHLCYSKSLKDKKKCPRSVKTKNKISKANSGEGNGMYGKKTWNTGTIGICKPNSGSFKKGQRSWNKGMGKFKKCKYCKRKMWVENNLLKRKKFCCRKCFNLFYKGRPRLNTRRKNNINWKNGITPLRVTIWRSLNGKIWRLKIFERDNFTCQMPNCDKTENFLNAHHLKEFSVIIKENNIKTLEDAEKCEELWNTSNGITLCKKCHKKVNNHEQEYYSIFTEILKFKLFNQPK